MKTNFFGLILLFACIKLVACQISLLAETISTTEIKVTILNSPGLFNKEQYWYVLSDANPPVYSPHPRCHWTIPNPATNFHCICHDLKVYTRYNIALQYCLTPGNCEYIAFTEGFTRGTAPLPPKFVRSGATDILMKIDCDAELCKLTARASGGAVKENECKGPTTECLITGLTASTTYNIHLSTKKQGFPDFSPASSEVVGRTAFGDLTNVKVIDITTNSATVLWDEPAGIKSVVVTLKQQGFAEVEEECKVAGAVRKCLFTDLPTSAKFSVVAEGCPEDVGGIPQHCSHTQPIYFLTAHAGPSGVIVTEVIWTFARVTVIAPEGLGEPIDSYVVNATQVGSNQMSSCMIKVNGFCGGSCYVRNLVTSTEYKVSTSACYRIDNITIECIPGKEIVSFTSETVGMNMVELIGMVLLVVLLVPAVIVFSMFGHGKL